MTHRSNEMQDLGLSRSFILQEGSLSLDESFEKLLEASGAGGRLNVSDDLIGTVVDSKYEVLSLVGEGGMGSVYSVRHLLLNKDMALKTFRSAELKGGAWQQYQREAQAIARLKHANIIQVFDFGVGKKNLPFYTMELLSGQSLADLITEKGRLPVNESVRIFTAVADGLAHAHRQGILHRDIKPANIFMEKSKGPDNPKIVDFGLAKLAARQNLEGQSATGPGRIFGSPLYMSPEQAAGGVTDARTDIYSFGCSFFHALTGRPPFVGDSAIATICLHQVKPPPRLVQAADGLGFPERLEAIMARLLAKDSKKRYQSFEEVKKDLSLLDLSLVKEAKLAQAETKTPPAESIIENASPVPAKRPVLLFVFAGLFALLLTGVIIAALFFPQSIGLKAGEKAISPLPIEQTNVAPADTFEITPVKTVVKPLPPPKPFFLKNDGKGGKIFQFPQQSIGLVSPASGGELVAAMGTVDVGASGKFKAGKFLSDHPEYFRGFAANDLSDLTLPRLLEWDNRHFAEISKLKGLEHLFLNGIGLTKADLKYFETLPYLSRLAVGETSLSGADLAQFASLRRLQTLEANYLTDLSPMLEKLQGDLVLQYISVKGCRLSDEDLKKIALMPSLTDICIDDNPFTAQGIGYLAVLRHLGTLRMGNKNVGPEVIDTLSTFHRLKDVRIDTRSWSPAAKNKLQEVLGPYCVIEDVVDK